MNTFLSIVASSVILVIVFFVIPHFGTSERLTVDTLTQAGYSNIQTGGYGWFECGRGDFYSTQFTATNPAGTKAQGVVCCGMIFKNCTVRFN